jgi:hypothetical protein
MDYVERGQGQRAFRLDESRSDSRESTASRCGRRSRSDLVTRNLLPVGTDSASRPSAVLWITGLGEVSDKLG